MAVGPGGQMRGPGGGPPGPGPQSIVAMIGNSNEDWRSESFRAKARTML